MLTNNLLSHCAHFDSVGKPPAHLSLWFLASQQSLCWCLLLRRVAETTAKYTLSSPPTHLIILSSCMCVSVVAGVMAGLGRHSSLSKRVCLCVCARLQSMLN